MDARAIKERHAGQGNQICAQKHERPAEVKLLAATEDVNAAGVGLLAATSAREPLQGGASPSTILPHRAESVPCGGGRPTQPFFLAIFS